MRQIASAPIECSMLNLESLKGLWDALTGIGTVSMAVATLVVVRQARRDRKERDRHHRDSLRPICVLTPHDGVDPQHWRDTLLTVSADAPRPDFGVVELKCALRNIGLGPALNVGIMFRIHDQGGRTTQPWELGPLQAGESRGSEDSPVRIPVQFMEQWQAQDFAQLPGRSWELILVYEDIFANSFHTMHAKNPLQMNRLHPVPGTSKLAAPSQPWVRIGEGTPPVRSGESLIFGIESPATRWWQRFLTRFLRRHPR